MNTEQPPFRSGFVSIIGRPNVGKSTLLNRILGQKIAIASPKPQTTRNRILGIHNLDDGQILFLDTPGIHRATGKLNRYMVDQAMAACADVDVVLFLIEATDRPGGGDDFILDVLSRSSVPVILVINKIDQVSPEALLPLIEIYAQKRDFAAIIPISGLKGSGVDALVKATYDLLPPGPRYYPEDMVTDLPERFIVAEMVREQILKQVRDEVPYGVAVVVESFTEKPDKDLVVIAAAILVEREPHKKIILGKGGEKIRAIGKAARVDIERMLGTRVYLELFVKVQKNWTESDKLLKEFGYE
ncbi:MAG: GTPase Era [Desulfuromonadales bacterium]|nr:GTPase Era [Desulfuromonadales bacterium]MDW7758254.1 GTPase Era [Desulfuromonadales bacterium]